MAINGLNPSSHGRYTVGNYSVTDAFPYLTAGTSLSFLLALWAFIVSFKGMRPHLQGMDYGKKVIVFQLCLIFSRMQV